MHFLAGRSGSPGTLTRTHRSIIVCELDSRVHGTKRGDREQPESIDLQDSFSGWSKMLDWALDMAV
jgi:hypothetical protein